MSGGRREIILVVIAGLIGLGGGLGGAWIGANAATDNQRDEAKEARQAEARQKRADTYSGFLKAAETYNANTQNLYRPRRCAGGKPICIPDRDIAALIAARSAFGNALNQVFIYGTTRAVVAAHRVEATLPTLASDANGAPQSIGHKPRAFQRAYVVMLNVACREVSADPRPTC